MQRSVKVVLAAIFVATLLVAVIALRGLADFELPEQSITNHRFNVADLSIDASLVLPSDCNNPAIAVIIHGDGAQNRWLDSGYLPLINALLDHCIGTFSWDKPGVGTSTGSWLNHSMQDRAVIASTALNFVQALTEISADRVGFLGFSQAGWVVPKATRLSEASFSVLIGPAVNWREQGRYFKTQRLRRDSFKSEEIERLVDEQTATNDLLFGTSGDTRRTTPKNLQQNMSKERLDFVRRSYFEDASDDIAKFRGPLLAVWGDADLNVDPVRNSEIYRQLLPSTINQRVALMPEATHGLLNSRWFNYQTIDQWPFSAKVLFAALGRRAYSKDSIKLIATWINSTVDK